MKNSQRGFIPILLLVIIAVVAVGGGAYYFYSSSKASWETYKSEQFKVAFNYPKNFIVQENQSFLLIGDSFGINAMFTSNVTMMIYKPEILPATTTLDTWQSYYSCPQETEINTSVGGQPAKRYTERQEGLVDKICVVNNHRGYLITMPTSNFPDPWQGIISSIKFFD